MPIILLLVHLFASDAQLRTVGYDNVVTTIGRWVPNGLMLAAEDGRDPRCHTAERRRDKEGRVGRGKRTYGGKSMMRSSG